MRGDEHRLGFLVRRLARVGRRVGELNLPGEADAQELLLGIDPQLMEHTRHLSSVLVVGYLFGDYILDRTCDVRHQ